MAERNFLNRTLWISDNLPVLRGINSECDETCSCCARTATASKADGSR